jgi:HSP20 family molecular chaperone IbpA
MSKELARRQETRPETVENSRWLKPACDVYENQEEWLISADVPGVSAGGLALHLDKSELTIQATYSGAAVGEGQAFAGYRRLFTLPSGIDADKVKAELREGVVSIHLPKSDAIRPRRIAVKAG